MARALRIGGAQMGPIQKAESRQVVVRRMLDLLETAKSQRCDLVVYPELALTTFFPRWYMTDQAEIDAWFEREMPNGATRPLFEQAARYGMAILIRLRRAHARRPSLQHLHPGRPGRRHCRQVPQGAFARSFGIRSATRLPAPGETLFRARRPRASRSGGRMGGIVGMCICNDRRWPETYRVMGLQGVELIVLGYNTPSVNSQKSDEGPQKRLFHNRLALQAGRLSELDLGCRGRQGGQRGRSSSHRQAASSSIPTARSSARQQPRATSSSLRTAISMPPSSARIRSSISNATGASSITAASPARPA